MRQNKKFTHEKQIRPNTLKVEEKFINLEERQQVKEIDMKQFDPEPEPV